MRAPQRKFVVEFKSRSRKPKVSTPASIWGDTDLKAVSRELEEQPDGPFAPSMGLPMATDTEPHRGEMQTVVPALDHPSFPGTTAASLPDLAKRTTTEVAPGLAADAEEKQPLPVEPSAGLGNRRGKARAGTKRKAKVTRQEKGRQPTGGEKAETYVTRADLDRLIAENRLLKAELRNQLMADNKRLREMLVRFS